MVGLLWQRYFLKSFFATFCFFLICFYGLYVLIDYATHTSSISSHHVQIALKDTFGYYFYLFAARAEILLPIAILIAFVKRITTLNSQQELAALMASGVSLKALLRPFLLFSCIIASLLLMNGEWVLPKALKRVRQLELSTKQQKKNLQTGEAVHHLLMEDGSLLLYQSYDPFEERFFDLFWIPSTDELYRIKYLYPLKEEPVGFYIDHIVRNTEGLLVQIEEMKESSFPRMRFNKQVLQSHLADPEFLPLSELAQKRIAVSFPLDEKEIRMATAFYWKLLTPFFCILAVLGPASFCVRFSRQMPVFFIFVASLFGLIAFYMFMDAMQVLSVRQILSPEVALFGPFGVAFLYFGWRFFRIWG